MTSVLLGVSHTASSAHPVKGDARTTIGWPELTSLISYPIQAKTFEYLILLEEPFLDTYISH